MKLAVGPTSKANLFQSLVIAAGGSVWLWKFADMLQYERATIGYVALMGVALLVVSLNPVAITTPGLKFGNKKHLSISLSDTVTFLTLILYGPQAAIVLAGLDGLIASRRTIKRWSSNFFTLAMLTLSVLAAARAYAFMMHLAGAPPQQGLAQSPFVMTLPVLFASTAHFLINSLLLAALIAFRYNRSLWRQLIDNHLWIGFTYLPLAGLALVLFACIKHFGWISVIGTTPVLFVIYFSYKQYNQKVEDKIRRIDEMNGLNLATVRSLALAIDARSGSSAGHAERVKIYVRGLARVFNLSEQETQALEAGAMLRDVGMLAVPDHVLTKPGQLSPAELERVKMHTIIGAEILGQIDFPYPVVPIVRHHHERWDGTGYPDGLRGEDIPLTARILSVADCFDASREKRSYRHAFDLERSVDWLRENSSKQFDPAVVEAFIENLPALEQEIAAWMQTQLAPTQRGNRKSVKVLPTQEGAAAYSHSLEQISGAHREVVTLYELAQSIGKSLSLPETLNLLLHKTRELVPSTTSAVLLHEKESGVFRAAHIIGDHADALREIQIDSQLDVILGAVESGTIRANIDPMPTLTAMGFGENVSYLTSMIVPLRATDGIVGAMILFSSEFKEFTSEDVRLMESVARLAGDAISNAVDHEETKETANTDRLTGLPNMRAMLKAFDAQVDYSRSSGRKFTFLMMDLDGFKSINDTFGHKTGDLFLIEISNRIRLLMRGSDIFGRYAGDEFVAILPNTSDYEARYIVDRIKEAVDSCKLLTDEGHEVRGGISIGISECDGYTSTLEELMSDADAAMYADKARRKKAILPAVKSQTA